MTSVEFESLKQEWTQLASQDRLSIHSADQSASFNKLTGWPQSPEEAQQRLEEGFDFARWSASPPRMICLRALSSKLSTLELRRVVRWSNIMAEGGRLILLMPQPEAFSRTPPLWPGEQYQGHFYRPLRQLFELLRLYGLRAQWPLSLELYVDGLKLGALVAEKISEQRSELYQRGPSKDLTAQQYNDQKYGSESLYRRFRRFDEPEILDDLCYALSKLKLAEGSRVMSLGCNDAQELEVFRELGREDLRFIGLDASQSAINEARRRFPEPQHEFHCVDLNDFQSTDYPDCQALLLLNVLQCTQVHRETLLRQLKPALRVAQGALVSIPNCHFLKDDIARRPLNRSDPRHDRSPLYKDMRSLARVFYRAGFQHVESFGSYDGFLCARRSSSPDRS